MKILGVTINQRRADWLQAIEAHVERQFCRHLSAREKGEVFLCALQHLAAADAEPVEPDGETLQWSELQPYANLIAAHFVRDGRDPDPETYREIIRTARQMATAQNTWIQ